MLLLVVHAGDELAQFRVGSLQVVVDENVIEERVVSSFDRAALADDLAVLLVGELLASIELEPSETIERRRSDADHVRVQVALVERADRVWVEVQNAHPSFALDDLADVVDGGAVECLVVLSEFDERVRGDSREKVRFGDEVVVDIGCFLQATRARGMRNGDVEEIGLGLE